MPGDLQRRHLGLKLSQLRTEGVARVAKLVAGNATGGAEEFPAMHERAPLLQARDTALQISQRPFRAWPAILEERILNWERMGGEITGRIGQIALQIVHHIHRSKHPPPVAGIGANIGIHARLRGHAECHPLGGLRLHQRAGSQHMGRLGHKRLLGEGWILGAGLGQLAEFLHRAGAGDHEIVRHDVRVVQHKEHRLASLHRQGFLVVGHPFIHRANAHHTHAQIGQDRALRLPLGRRQEGGEVFGKLPSRQTGIAGPLFHRGRTHRFKEAPQQRCRLLRRPQRQRNFFQSRNRGIAIISRFHKRRNSGKGLSFAAAHASQGGKGRPAHGAGQPISLAHQQHLGSGRGGGLPRN